MARAAILCALVVGVIALAHAADTTVTNKVFFDVDIDGKAAGALQHARLRMCCPAKLLSTLSGHCWIRHPPPR